MLAYERALPTASQRGTHRPHNMPEVRGEGLTIMYNGAMGTGANSSRCTCTKVHHSVPCTAGLERSDAQRGIKNASKTIYSNYKGSLIPLAR